MVLLSVRHGFGRRGWSTRRGGFTLIELLVVVAIIAILAAILFPVFAKAKERALLTQCVSNMHQLSFAVLSYADDWDGTLPWWCLSPCGQVWDEGVYDYVKEKTIYTCPKNYPPGVPHGILIRSYALPRNVSGLGLGEIPSPGRTVLLFEKGNQRFSVIADATGETFWQTWGTDEWVTGQQYWDPWERTYWHGRGKVLAFLDGHAKYHSVTDRDRERNPFYYKFSDHFDKDGYCGDKVLGYGYTGCTAHNAGANLPP